MGQHHSKQPKHQQRETLPTTNSPQPSTPTSTPAPKPRPSVTPIATEKGHISDITRPATPPTLTRLSSLLDPIVTPVILSSSPTETREEIGDDEMYSSNGGKGTGAGASAGRCAGAGVETQTLAGSASRKASLTIRSPSGNLLGMTSYFERADRPLSMRERQERVRMAMERAQRGESRFGERGKEGDGGGGGGGRDKEGGGGEGEQKKLLGASKRSWWSRWCCRYQ